MTLSDKRQRARYLERRAARKINRLKNSNNADISGTKFDPRKGGMVGRYNNKQLDAHIGRLESFLSRKTQFHGDRNGKIIPEKKWRQYKSLEAKVNKQTSAYFESVKNKKTPSNVTVEWHQRLLKPRRPWLSHQSVNSPFITANRKSKNVLESKLDGLIEVYQDRLKPDYRARQVAKAREQFADMLENSGFEDIIKEYDDLSDDKFERLWFYSSEIADAASLIYFFIVQQRHDSSVNHVVYELAQDSARDLRALAKWARGNFRGEAY